MRHSKLTRQFVLTLIIVFVLQATMLAYVFSAFYKSSVTDIKDLGVSNLKSQATMVENYLTKPLNGAITVETVHSILHRYYPEL